MDEDLRPGLRPSRSWPLLLAAVIVLAGTGANATAIAPAVVIGGVALTGGEALVPDLRLELPGELILSWPIHPWAIAVPRESWWSTAWYLSPFIEPQLAPRATMPFRLLTGARTGGNFGHDFGLAVFAEGAARFAGDGVGAVAGMGVGAMVPQLGPFGTVAIVFRRSWTPSGVRHDIALDLTLPLNLLVAAALGIR